MNAETFSNERERKKGDRGREEISYETLPLKQYFHYPINVDHIAIFSIQILPSALYLFVSICNKKKEKIF